MNSGAAERIRAIVLDIDGVLTDGRIGYGAAEEIKFFHVRDGHGIKLAQRAGLMVGCLSGRSAEANRKRALELGLQFLYEGRHDKLAAFEVLLAEQGLRAEECLYIGDDVVDMPVMRRAGIAVAVADGVPELEEVCDFRTRLPGGRGAVRETIDWLLKEQKKWDMAMARYRG